MEHDQKLLEEEITRKDFLKKTACLALCPFLLQSISACGDSDDSNGDASKTSTVGKKVEQSKYSSMTTGSAKSLELEGTSQGIVLYKKSDSEYVAFDATCPHEGGKVIAESTGSTLGVCNKHGAIFAGTGSCTDGPPKGQSLKVYSVTVESDHLLVKI